ncbi:hypothetical protein FPQ18DRAFT_403484 [Pyronema domesticum]|nr:hypothetical protein FPQ18DRAFT_403484 [Pyronema domesticum]
MSSEMTLDHITIAALYWESVAAFNRLLDHFNKSSHNPPDTLPDDCGWLRGWAENAAAHRRGVISLDHQALSVKESVKGLMMELNNIREETLVMALEEAEAKDIEQNSTKPDETTEPPTGDSEMDDELRSTSPLKEAVKKIGNIITCLTDYPSPFRARYLKIAWRGWRE